MIYIIETEHLDRSPQEEKVIGIEISDTDLKHKDGFSVIKIRAEFGCDKIITVDTNELKEFINIIKNKLEC